MPMTANPRILYRGYLPNCGNMGLCTGFQFFVNGAVKKAFTGGVNRPLSPLEQVSAGFVAGASSFCIAGPTELIMIQQQRKGASLGATVAGVMKEGPATFLRFA
jgi:hypothetical protein